MNAIYLILKDDLIYYPPVLSIVYVLLEKDYKVVYIGNYTDEDRKRDLEKRGVLFIPMVKLKEDGSLFKKLMQKLAFRKQVSTYLKTADISANDYLWLFHTETLCLLHKTVNYYRVIFHPLEFTLPVASWKYKVLSPSLNLAESVRRASKVVCCEYNRAQITKGMYALERMPFVLPNKMYMGDEELAEIPGDVENLII